MRGFIFFLLFAFGTAQAGRALGEDAPPMAESRYKAGLKAYRAGNYAMAAREFQVALELYPKSAKLAYNAARCLERADQPRKAIELYRRYLELAPKAKDRAEVETLIKALGKLAPEQRGKLAVRSTPEGASVTLDGAAAGQTPLEVELLAGGHQLVVEAEGYEPVNRAVEVKAAGTLEVNIPLSATAVVAPAPPPAGPGWKTYAGWGGVGVGALGLGLGAVFLGQAASAADEAEGLHAVDEDKRSDLESEHGTFQTLGWVSIGVGVVGVGVGVALLMAPDETGVSLGPTGVVGRF